MKKKTVRQYPPQSCFRDYVETLASRGDKVAFRFFADVTCRSVSEVSYGDLARDVRAFAAAYDGRGLTGGRVAIIGETSVSWVTAYLGAVGGGSVAIPIDRELSFQEILGFLEKSEADTVVYGRALSAKFDEVVGTLPTVRTFLPIDRECPSLGREGVTLFADFLAEGREKSDFVLPETDDGVMAEMLFTSGTTGTSKCVMLTRKNILAAMNSACETVEFFPDDTIVSVLPIHHTYELCCMLAGLNYGMTVAINDSIRHVMKSFATFRPTGLVLVPLFVETFYKKIWEEAKKKKADRKLKFALRLSRFLRGLGIDLRRRLFASVWEPFGGRLCKIVCGGAALSPAISRAFEDLGVQIMEGYGITECAPLIAVDPYYRPKYGSVGPTVPCCRVRIENPTPGDKGFPEGEIAVQGDNVMLGYYDNEAENKAAFTDDGWYLTGDVGYLDGDGYIYLTGRKKSVIVLENGKNVFPEEIEEYLSKVPGILESVVVGRRNGDDLHVTLTAIVVPDPAVFEGRPETEVYETLHQAVQALNKKLVAFKQIRALELRAEPFEKTTSKKIKRHLVH